MMIQRDTPVRLWGWADKGESVRIRLNGQTLKVKTGKDGTWNATLKAMPFGGPYEMIIQGKGAALTVKNILVGDIWVCSGQSNMQWTVNWSKDAEKEVSEAGYPQIRLLSVARKMSAVPLQEAAITGDGWQECNPQTVGDFTAAGYFFGRELHRNLNIPVGLIDCSWGGTNIETWMSLPTIEPYAEYREKVQEMQNSAALQKEIDRWYWMDLANMTIEDTGMTEKWFAADVAAAGWKPAKVPGKWSESGVRSWVVWYRKEFVLTAEQAAQPLSLHLGQIDDRDETYLNGHLAGATNRPDIARSYTVCPEWLREGKNELAVRVVNTGGDAGFGSDKICFRSGETDVPLAGEWLYRESEMPFRPAFMPNEYPALLYHAMLLPLTRFPVKGAIWYQGESNAGEAWKYRFLLPDLITGWRNAWKQNDLPFYYVQLANFMEPDAQPAESQWAELRESQHKTLGLPHTGEAVIIDIGEEKDIHPRNKQEVGRRLALNALAKTYGRNIEYSGPEYVSMKVDGDIIRVTFSHIGDRLVVKKRKYEYLQGFAIAGANKKFVWAKAFIDGNTVVVHSSEVKAPVAVRYAWGNNPDDANLYNSLGLPASPFRTDEWKLDTQK
ncbi:MAG: 9-O-acetylesterase [Tannerella sp.]|nr:9-O-acetylesterase [Tannerella sp.]